MQNSFQKSDNSLSDNETKLKKLQQDKEVRMKAAKNYSKLIKIEKKNKKSRGRGKESNRSNDSYNRGESITKAMGIQRLVHK